MNGIVVFFVYIFVSSKFLTVLFSIPPTLEIVSSTCCMSTVFKVLEIKQQSDPYKLDRLRC